MKTNNHVSSSQNLDYTPPPPPPLISLLNNHQYAPLCPLPQNPGREKKKGTCPSTSNHRERLPRPELPRHVLLLLLLLFVRALSSHGRRNNRRRAANSERTRTHLLVPVLKPSIAAFFLSEGRWMLSSCPTSLASTYPFSPSPPPSFIPPKKIIILHPFPHTAIPPLEHRTHRIPRYATYIYLYLSLSPFEWTELFRGDSSPYQLRRGWERGKERRKD